MKKKIIFRADGNTSIGLGHLYRVFALIEMLKEDFECIVVTKDNSTLKIFPHSYKVNNISSEFNVTQECDWLSKNYDPSNYIIVLDGYHFTSFYQKIIKRYGYNLIFIDDLAKDYMYADVVVNHSIGLRVCDYISESYTKFALGSKFTIIRPLFIQAAKKVKNYVEPIKTIFVCFGGSDVYDLTYTCIKGISKIDRIKCINVVVGEAYINDELKNLEVHRDLKINIYKNISEFKMIKILNQSHMAIVPSSTICYEVCSVKMPIMAGYYVDNQKFIYEGFKRERVIYPVGDYRNMTYLDFKLTTENLLSYSLNKHEELQYNQHNIFDGGQKSRFLQIVNSL